MAKHESELIKLHICDDVQNVRPNMNKTGVPNTLSVFPFKIKTEAFGPNHL